MLKYVIHINTVQDIKKIICINKECIHITTDNECHHIIKFVDKNGLINNELFYNPYIKKICDTINYTYMYH